jgi:hypothetical protein
MEISNPKQIENLIYVIRGQKVMLDKDLADLYEISTGRMNEQVKGIWIDFHMILCSN